MSSSSVSTSQASSAKDVHTEPASVLDSGNAPSAQFSVPDASLSIKKAPDPNNFIPSPVGFVHHYDVQTFRHPSIVSTPGLHFNPTMSSPVRLKSPSDYYENTESTNSSISVMIENVERKLQSNMDSSFHNMKSSIVQEIVSYFSPQFHGTPNYTTLPNSTAQFNIAQSHGYDSDLSYSNGSHSHDNSINSHSRVGQINKNVNDSSSQIGTKMSHQNNDITVPPVVDQNSSGTFNDPTQTNHGMQYHKDPAMTRNIFQQDNTSIQPASNLVPSKLISSATTTPNQQNKKTDLPCCPTSSLSYHTPGHPTLTNNQDHP